MEWVILLNQSIEYIEEHLTEEILLEEVAKVAGCSTYHYQRMFSYLANMSLAEYIRRRKMTKAAVDLQDGQMKVMDVALKYGYTSPTAFNRAFQTIHGIAPSQAKMAGAKLKAYPKISFQMMIKGDVEMEYRIEKRESFQVIGLSTPMNNDIETNFHEVPLLWRKAAAEGYLEQMMPLMDGEPKGVLGISACANEDEETWRYFIAVSSQQEPPTGMEKLTIPAGTWAIFPGRGKMPDDIQMLERRMVTEWLPTSGYEYANAPDIELYFNADPLNAVYEVWLPVVKKG